MPRRLLHLLLSLTGLLVCAPVAAHETVAVLGALDTASGADVCGVFGGAPPLVAVRTSIGLVTADADGAWRYGCPSLLGDNVTSVFAAAAGGRLIAGVVSGALHVSTDGGCTWFREELPGDDAFAYELLGDDDAVWVLARDVEEARLLRLADDGELVSYATWSRSGDEGWTPDALHVDRTATGTRIYVAGARPAPQAGVFRVEGQSIVQEIAWRLPETGVAIQRLAPRGQLADGAMLLVLTDAGGRRVVSSRSESELVTVSTLIPASQAQHGPVRADGRWLALSDGVIWTIEDDGSAGGHATVPWKCLQQVDGRLFACNLYDLLEITDVDAALGDGSGTQPVFSTAQIGPPDPGCGRDAPADQLCADDWIHYGTENGFVTRTPALCPDGSGEYPTDGLGPGDGSGGLDGGAGGTSGCTAASAASPLWAVLAFVRRRRRA